MRDGKDQVKARPRGPILTQHSARADFCHTGEWTRASFGTGSAITPDPIRSGIALGCEPNQAIALFGSL